METLHGTFTARKVDQDTKVIVDSAFSMIVPKGMKVSTDSKEIGDDKFIALFEPVDNDLFTDSVGLEYSASNCKVRIDRNKTTLDIPTDFSDPVLRKKLEDNFKASLIKGTEILVALGGNPPKPFVVKSDEEAIIVANDQGMLGVALFLILVPKGLYTGMYYVGDSETEDGYAQPETRRSFLTKLLSQVSLPDPKEIKDAFFLPVQKVSYNQKQKENLGMCTVSIPDHMVFSSAEQLPPDLKARMSFVIVPEGTYRGPAGYQDVSVSIYGEKPLYIPGQKADWKNIVPSQTMPMTRPVTLVREEDGLVAARFRFSGSDDPDAFWRSYVYTIFAGDNRLTGMFYFNHQAPEEVFENVVDTWLNHITLSSVDEKAQMKMQKEALGPMAGKNGLIDAMAVIRLFQDDVLFFPEEPFDRSNGTIHLYPQFNQPKLTEYPYIIKHKEVISGGLGNLFLALDNEKSLQLKREQIHENLQPSLLDDRLTGLSFLNLLAYHLFRLDQTDKGYRVILDKSVAYGIPHIYDYVSRFLTFVRKYNGITEPFDVQFMLAVSLLSTDENGNVAGQRIDEEDAVPGADVGKMKKGSLVIHVNPGDRPVKPNKQAESAEKTDEDRIEEILAAKKKRELQIKEDRSAISMVSDLKTDKRSRQRKYERDVHSHIHDMQRSSYSGPWDSSYIRDMRKLQDILDSYGEDIERMIKSVLERYEKKKNQWSVIARSECLREVELIVRDLKETDINNSSTGEKLTYSLSWDFLRRMNKYSDETSRMRILAKKEEIARRKQIRDEKDAQFAQTHHISLKNVGKHRSYLEAKKLMDEGKNGNQLRNTAKRFKEIQEYLDSSQLAEECIKKADELDAEAKNRLLQWENDCKMIDQKRKEYHQQLHQQTLDEYQEDINRLEQDFNEKKLKLQQEITDQENQIQLLEKELEGLGMFAVFRKKEIRRKIETHSQKKITKYSEIKQHRECLKKKSSERKDELEQKQKELQNTADKAFPYPKKPEIQLNEAVDSDSDNNQIQKPDMPRAALNEPIKDHIMDIIYNSSKPLTIAEINRQLYNQKIFISNQKASALLRQLVNEKLIVEDKINKAKVYSMP